MEENDNNMVFDFICQTTLPKEIYEKATEKCKEANTTLYEFIRAVICQLANGEIKIMKKDQHEDKGE